ncbi:MAG: alpha/beta fold hydrolase [Rhodobacteraceae bacterium]|nr:alpha/beta fold hydrolase [Paracoccaceae bacterium]
MPDELVDLGGTVLRVRRQGESGPALVLLHEMGGTLDSWDGVMAALQADHRLLAQDLRGFGQSEKIRGAVSMADLAADTGALIRHAFPGERVWIAGCAVGAGIALQLGLDAPELVLGVVAFAPATGTPEPKRAEVLERIAALERDGLRAFFPALQERQFPARYRDDPARATQFHLRRLTADPASYAAVWRAMAICDIEDRLLDLRCPVTLVAGEADGTRPPALVRSLAERIPGARFVTIDSGHAMPVITPGAVATEIRSAMGQGGAG